MSFLQCFHGHVKNVPHDLACLRARAALICVIFACLGRTAQADVITFVDRDEQRVSVEAGILGQGQGQTVLELYDGTLMVIPTAVIVNRVAKEMPKPATPEEMIAIIRRRLYRVLIETKAKAAVADGESEDFPMNRLRTQIEGPNLTVMVLSAPVPSKFEPRVKAFLGKASKFMDTVDNVFERYAKDMKFPLHDPKFPLVLMLFESDAEFDQYTELTTGGNTLSASNILGFYSPMTNWLTVRMSACDSFAVPLHEAVHLQMYNRVLQRMSGAPKWFDEGIAAGFENSGEKINVNPLNINANYARKLIKGTTDQASWSQLVADDTAFQQDILAGDAYAQGWALHWMLATQKKEQYSKFVQELAQREPLAVDDKQDREKNFSERFGVSPQQLQKDFPKPFEAAVKKQKVTAVDPEHVPGHTVTQQQLGKVVMESKGQVGNGGLKSINIKGELKNISTFRAMTYYVTCEFLSGHYCDWLVPDVEPTKVMPLKSNSPTKIIPEATPKGQPTSFRLRIVSTPADSEEAKAWKAGEVPLPKSDK